jgi:hypothetical protein
MLQASFFCTDHRALLRSLIREGMLPGGPPQRASLHGVKKSKLPDDWIEQLQLAGRTYTVYWPEDSSAYVAGPDLVVISSGAYALDADRLTGQLANVEFDAGSFHSIHGWSDPAGPGYKAPDSTIGRAPLGFGLAFRGGGHGRVMSRRWLDRGPWRVLRTPNDTTFVQFHDLDADVSISAAQARPGHMIASHVDQEPLPLRGAYLPGPVALRGTYVLPDRQLVVSVVGRTISRCEMRDAVAARFYQLLGTDQPLDNVVYSFLDKTELDQALPDLWLYGHEARLRDGTGWHRMDNKYTPPSYEKPDWVKQLGRDDKVAP